MLLAVQASIAANTYVVSGHAETKKLQDLLPGIINQLGPDNLANLKKLAETYQSGGGPAPPVRAPAHAHPVAQPPSASMRVLRVDRAPICTTAVADRECGSAWLVWLRRPPAPTTTRTCPTSSTISRRRLSRAC